MAIWPYGHMATWPYGHTAIWPYGRVYGGAPWAPFEKNYFWDGKLATSTKQYENKSIKVVKSSLNAVNSSLKVVKTWKSLNQYDKIGLH